VMALKIAIGLGITLIMIFNDPQASFGTRMAKGLWELYNITGVVGDLLSYVRLFALGMCSGVLGSVINSLGALLLAIPIPVIPKILFVLFLIVAHVLNMGLSCLGSFVHPMRLTFVEFYKNCGFEGGGKAFTPLKKYSSTQTLDRNYS
jgi:V/A-type H+/Na+-transporting ATPase subunit I